MPYIKGGVWTNIEDEILKAAVSKYGLNQWARVSSLLARKTPKQCKARWAEWLDPGIRKIEWSREEDEKLLHLAKLMPTQWRTIAPIVGRTATQCLERYQKLLDEAEARENQELGFAGQEGGETAAPSADDVRRLRPGELDPDPESKPARPDTIDMDEDEKEMLSEARARLANTQGKKAKRKARERQLEESRRLAVLQKRRELKHAGINIKVTTRKKGQMDYNADIPFEKAPAPGFFDTQDEEATNERQRQMFDPRKQQLANKRKGDQQDEALDSKRRKNDKDGPGAGAAAARAARLQRMREAEQSSKRRALVLPTPQVSDRELEDIVKMGLSGDRANPLTDGSDSAATRGLVGSYNTSLGATPIRTPRAPQGEDRIATELRNARARTDTQSALLGGDNTLLSEEDSSRSSTALPPPSQTFSTPNPLATPFRNANGLASGAVSNTPLRTPRDSLSLNPSLPGSTPQLAKSSLRAQLARLPKPQQSSFELEALPSEQDEEVLPNGETAGQAEDAAERDRRAAAQAHAEALNAFRRETKAVQKGLPRPRGKLIASIQKWAEQEGDGIGGEIARGVAELMLEDESRFGGRTPNPQKARHAPPSDEALQRAQMEIILEMGERDERDRNDFATCFESEWLLAHTSQPDRPAPLPGLAGYTGEETSLALPAAEQDAFEALTSRIETSSQSGFALEKRLAKLHGGYAERQRKLRTKIVEAADALARTEAEIERGRIAAALEEVAIAARLEGLRAEVAFVSRREREAQETFRGWREELEAGGS